MTTEVLRSMLYRGSEITREAALVVRWLRHGRDCGVRSRHCATGV